MRKLFKWLLRKPTREPNYGKFEKQIIGGHISWVLRARDAYMDLNTSTRREVFGDLCDRTLWILAFNPVSKEDRRYLVVNEGKRNIELEIMRGNWIVYYPSSNHIRVCSKDWIESNYPDIKIEE